MSRLIYNDEEAFDLGCMAFECWNTITRSVTYCTKKHADRAYTIYVELEMATMQPTLNFEWGAALHTKTKNPTEVVR